MTKAEMKELEKRLQEEIKKNGEFSKRAIFLKATINLELEQLGKSPRYTW